VICWLAVGVQNFEDVLVLKYAEKDMSKPVEAVAWDNGELVLLDQRHLPLAENYLRFSLAADVAWAIQAMVVRGAPAIGIAAAYGYVLAARAAFAAAQSGWIRAMRPKVERLRESRPTAVNLAWALSRMEAKAAQISGNPEPALLAEAQAIHAEDVAANLHMGELGANYIAPGSTVLTHCNAGALATGGYGTALGVIRSAYARGHLRAVFADETRPWLQGARLTAWELTRDGVPTTLIADVAAAHLMKTKGIQWVIVGADRIAANGDTANKIGTYQLAIAAKAHGTKVMVVAPASTFDLSIESGASIPIELRSEEELLSDSGKRRAAPEASGWNPVFDVTPAELIEVIITERGAIEHPNTEKIAAIMR
jgi:methylthioribose-1-phosphate isomerase